MKYDFEMPRIKKIAKKYKRIALQFPEGLKDQATEIANEISKAGCEVIISSDPCYGACDLADDEAKTLGCDALFHFGHAELLRKTAIPVIYVEARADADPIPLISKNLDKLPKKIGLVTTVQHIHTLEKVKRFLEKNGFEVHIGKPGGRAKYAGQVLGCSFASARNIVNKVDCFVYIGSGNFHPLGVSLSTGKPTLAYDVLLGEVRDMDILKDRFMRQRFARIASAKDAKTFGIIIGEKKGQMRRVLAQRIKKKLEKPGKEAHIISSRELSPETLLSFRKLDVLVNTTCPRIAIDDAVRYKQPFLTPKELEILIGERKWEEYDMDEMD